MAAEKEKIRNISEYGFCFAGDSTAARLPRKIPVSNKLTGLRGKKRHEAAAVQREKS
ncbi:MAG: hypothetical protein IJB59_02185 [Oscillospiraceae bacterium]|nr:hypothetical protein [Oscillospiraceae bacterium]